MDGKKRITIDEQTPDPSGTTPLVDRRALDGVRAFKLSELVKDALLDMPMERGGSAVLRGEETSGTGKRWYVCLAGESPMTEQTAARVVKSLLELSADALRGLSPAEAAALSAALQQAADSFPLWAMAEQEEASAGSRTG